MDTLGPALAPQPRQRLSPYRGGGGDSVSHAFCSALVVSISRAKEALRGKATMRDGQLAFGIALRDFQVATTPGATPIFLATTV